MRLAWHFEWPLYQGPDVFQIYYPPHDEATWEDAWRAIVSLRGLRDLRVKLSHAPALRIDDERLLRPLSGVKNPRRFEVHLAWQGLYIGYVGSPFQVLRPGQAEEGD